MPTTTSSSSARVRRTERADSTTPSGLARVAIRPPSEPFGVCRTVGRAGWSRWFARLLSVDGHAGERRGGRQVGDPVRSAQQGVVAAPWGRRRDQRCADPDDERALLLGPRRGATTHRLRHGRGHLARAPPLPAVPGGISTAGLPGVTILVGEVDGTSVTTGVGWVLDDAVGSSTSPRHRTTGDGGTARRSPPPSGTATRPGPGGHGCSPHHRVPDPTDTWGSERSTTSRSEWHPAETATATPGRDPATSLRARANPPAAPAASAMPRSGSPGLVRLTTGS